MAVPAEVIFSLDDAEFCVVLICSAFFFVYLVVSTYFKMRQVSEKLDSYFQRRRGF